MFKQPFQKNNKFIAMTKEKINIVLSDIKIKSIFKFKNDSGYLLSVFIPSSVNKDIIDELIELDKRTFCEISKMSSQWFNKSLNEEELETLYNPTYCTQSSVINVILSNNMLINSTYDNKNLNDVKEIFNILNDKNLLKNCLIDIKISHNGVHFYKEQASNKWLIQSIHIINTSEDTFNMIDEYMIEKLKDNMIVINKKTQDRIVDYKKKIECMENDLKCANEILNNIMNSDLGDERINQIDKIISIQKDMM